MRRSPVEGEVIGTGSQGRTTLRVEGTGRRVTRWTLVTSLRWGIRVGDVHDVRLISACEGADARGSCLDVSF